MIKKSTFLGALSLMVIFFSVSLFAQSHFPGNYAVYFTDKNSSTFSLNKPLEFLSQKSLDRRTKQNILLDNSDLPVSPVYLTQLLAYGNVKYTSRWQNSALIVLNDSQSYLDIQKLVVVDHLEYLGSVAKKKKKKTHKQISKGETYYEPTFDSLPSYGATRNQLDLLGLTPMHHAGYVGSGITIAILDAGFYKADKAEVFKLVRDRGGIITTKDFVVPHNNVYKENSHGTYVMSTIAGDLPNKYFGAAPGVDFILLRTEDVQSEFPVEEYYWLVGAEFADSTGVDIITSSLSYTQFDDTTLNHNWDMMDGESTIVSRAATKAFDKGILVVTSAGNDGANAWRKIGFPGDAKNVLTIGAVDSLGSYASLSSVGYASDGRIKPDLMAVGKATALVSGNDFIFYGNGTSFSTPTIAGAIATVVQANPEASAVKIRDAILHSAHQYLQPDSILGYGIPDFFVANLILKDIPIDTAKKELNFQVLPNPFDNGFYLVTAPIDTQIIDVSIYDISGKNIWQAKLSISPGTSAFYINGLYNKANGLYFIKLKVGDKAYTRKIIKQR